MNDAVGTPGICTLPLKTAPWIIFSGEIDVPNEYELG